MSAKKSLAVSVLEDFAPEYRVIALEGGPRPRLLNGTVVPDRHRYAVLDSEGETLATAPSREAAVEAAAREALRRYARRAERDAYRLARFGNAVAVIAESIMEASE